MEYRMSGSLEDVSEIDVGRVIELPATELAKAQHAKAQLDVGIRTFDTRPLRRAELGSDCVPGNRESAVEQCVRER